MSQQFDIIVFGASGFTGRLVAEYLAATYPTGVSWAMGGRSLEKLAQVRDEIGAPADTPLVVCDSDDAASLKAMVTATKVVLTTVGPYQLYGEPLVAACAEAGTDYVDLCGEPAWMAQMIAAYGDKAKASGANLAEVRREAGSVLHGDGLNDWPDLVMIDGGKGQLSAVMEALRELDLQEELVVCSLAKAREEVFVPGASQPLQSEADQLGVTLLRRLRDEAHRFAITYHRQQRGERQRRSRLGDIPGLGPKRVKDLLAHFRSVEAIQLASAEQIAKAPGIGPALADQVWQYFHPNQEGQEIGESALELAG